MKLLMIILALGLIGCSHDKYSVSKRTVNNYNYESIYLLCQNAIESGDNETDDGRITVTLEGPSCTITVGEEE